MFGTQSLTPAPRTEPTSFPLLASHAGVAVPAGREASDAGSREFLFCPVPAGTCRGEKLFGLTLTSPGPSPMVPLSVFPLCSAPSSLLGELVPRPEQLLPSPPSAVTPTDLRPCKMSWDPPLHPPPEPACPRPSLRSWGLKRTCS